MYVHCRLAHNQIHALCCHIYQGWTFTLYVRLLIICLISIQCGKLFRAYFWNWKHIVPDLRCRYTLWLNQHFTRVPICTILKEINKNFLIANWKEQIVLRKYLNSLLQISEKSRYSHKWLYDPINLFGFQVGNISFFRVQSSLSLNVEKSAVNFTKYRNFFLHVQTSYWCYLVTYEVWSR